MFKRIRPIEKPVTLHFEQSPVLAQAGDSVAAALLAAGITSFRKSAEADEMRGPYCMIGNCFECRVEIDGKPDQLACRVRVREGMQVRLQRGSRVVEVENAD